MRSEIPQIIHQTWKNGDLPFFVSECHRRVKEMNPTWDHRFYKDGDMEEVIARVAAIGNNRFLSVEEFRSIPSGIEKADVFRCAALYEVGGIYCDLDMEFLRPATELLAEACNLSTSHRNAELFLTTDHPIHCARLYHNEEFVMNHFMIARPMARFLGDYLEEVTLWVRRGELSKTPNPVFTTGPGLMTRIFKSTLAGGSTVPPGVALLPPEWIHPLPDMAWNFPEIKPYDDMIRNLTWRKKINSFTVHYWWHNYCGGRCIFDIYGESIFHPGV